MEEQRSLAQMVEESLTLAKENNKLLKAMRRDAFIGGLLKTLLWVALLGASFYFSMKFLEPYLGILQTIPTEETDYQSLFEQYKHLLGQ